jgi:hypothetical protein
LQGLAGFETLSLQFYTADIAMTGCAFKNLRVFQGRLAIGAKPACWSEWFWYFSSFVARMGLGATAHEKTKPDIISPSFKPEITASSHGLFTWPLVGVTTDYGDGATCL